MYIIETKTGLHVDVLVELVEERDYKKITKRQFFFLWKTEKNYSVYKLRKLDADEILGLISMNTVHEEKRVEIRLLAVGFENRGSKKIYARISGNLMAFACRQALFEFGSDACVSLFPKTELRAYFKSVFGMKDAGKQLFVVIPELTRITEKFEL